MDDRAGGTHDTADPRRSVPRTDFVLADPRLAPALDALGHDFVKRVVREAQDAARRGDIPVTSVVEHVLGDLPQAPTSLRRVVNATGVVLHTNLGRAPLSPAAVDALTHAAGYVDVEYDVHTGARAQRGRGALDALREAIPAAGDVHVVNNGAAALVLATSVLAAGRDVVMSRGEMVEIGDGFRIPELVEAAGATLREVGTTNRTRLDDYAAVVGPDTGFVLKVHPSNFRIDGFTSSVTVEELAGLGVPVVADIGSGLLAPDPLLPGEPDATSWLRAGATIVTSSGDKLLGGPQAGIIAGEAETVRRLRRHPLARALRVDKLTLAALEATLRGRGPTALSMVHATEAGLRERAGRLADRLRGAGVPVDVVASAGAVGGGGAPGLPLAGWAVALDPRFADVLRRGNPCVVGRVEHGRCLLDLRCVSEADERLLLDAVVAAAAVVDGPDTSR